MNEKQNVVETQLQHEVHLVDILLILTARKKLMVYLPLSIALCVGLISLSLPNVYKASTNILPPQQAQSGAAGLLAQLGGVATMAAGVTGLKSPAELYVGMLRSRTIADKIVEKHGLMKVYGLDSAEKTRAELEERTAIQSGKDGLILISVEDRDPTRAADLANQYVKELFALTNVLAVTDAGQRRIFFERQLEQAKNNLAVSEQNLKGSLAERGVISVDAESRTMVEAVARLRAQISAKEIELNATKAFLTSEHPQYKYLKEQIGSLRAELSKFENGSKPERSNSGRGSETGEDRMAGLENIKALREVKYQQLLYELLAKQYEAARLDEAKEAPIIQVLDKAIPPERKSKPKRLLIALASYIGAFVLCALFTLFAEAKRKAMSVPATAQKWQQLRALFYRR
jgi:uncharacterized protein involved in exopolysaccharide biosynthesis